MAWLAVVLAFALGVAVGWFVCKRLVIMGLRNMVTPVEALVLIRRGKS